MRARVSLRDTALYLGSSFLLLAIIVRYVWLLWVFRQSEWYFATFLFAFAPILLLALAAYVISVPRVPAPDVRGHYLAEARPFYYLMVVFFVLWSLSDLFSASRFATAPVPPAIFAMRALGITASLVLAHTKKPVLHAVILSLAVVAVVSASVAFVSQL